ncbi:MAG TPA: FAD-dependent oxidoreductase, partial [Gammaproteobacteria bacterium]|nr:FAD-dependent oxidoreductase [Gammaproteobacteria bacterium]
YEAKNRVGGKVHSVLVQNLENTFSIGELGGQNITDGGEAKNIRALIHELDLTVVEDTLEFSRAFFTDEKIYDIEALLAQENFNPSTMKEALLKFAKESDSMQDVLDKLFEQKPILKRIFSCQLAGYEGSPARLLSTYYHLETLEYGLLGGLSETHQATGSKPTIHLASIPGGNALLPLKMASIMKEKIYLQKVLKKVKRSYDNKIELLFGDGETTVCDKLILAIPCSVFKDIVFENVIPEKQLALMKSVQYGINAKILTPMHYKKTRYTSFGSDTVSGFSLGDKKILTLYFLGETSVDILDHLQESYQAAMVACNAVFQGSQFTHSPPIIAEDMQFTRYTCPVAKSWVQDPYAQGAYSNVSIALKELFFEKMPYKNIQVKTLFKPIDDALFFIGEHTTLIKEIGTMEAAVESGERITELF